jgi:hypothetical protein
MSGHASGSEITTASNTRAGAVTGMDADDYRKCDED